jgi:hypothetical protein
MTVVEFAVLTLPGFALLLFVAAQFIWRGDREIRAATWHGEGRCEGCGYDLRGNQNGVCPECGRPALGEPHES